MKAFLVSNPLLMGFIMDLILGDPENLPHPVKAIGNCIARFEKFTRKHFADHLRTGGFFLAASVLIITSGIAFLILLAAYQIHFWFGMAVESVMCYYLIAPKCLHDESMKVYHALKENELEKARKAVSMIVGRDTDQLDSSGITRAAVETVAENTSDGIVAPLLFMALGGAAFGFFYKAANTMDSMIGYSHEKYADIGFAAAKLDDFLNFIPSRMTAWIMIFSAFFLRLDSKNAFRIWRRDRRKHASPNSAQTESVCAGALDIRLAGDAYYFGELHPKPYIGDAIRPVEPEDIRRANRLMYVTSILALVLSMIVRAIIFGGVWIAV